MELYYPIFAFGKTDQNNMLGEENLDATQEEIMIEKEMLINRLKERGTFTLFRDYKVVFCYEFFDKNNILMKELMITPGEY